MQICLYICIACCLSAINSRQTTCYAKVNSNEQINKMEIERKDTELKVIQTTENIDAEHN